MPIRLIFLALVGAIVATVTPPAIGQSPAERSETPPAVRPHIVMAFADDWGLYAGAYDKHFPGTANGVAHTPHFDAIAADGALFLNAHVSAPSCTPCRSSLMSGQPFWRCGKASILSGAEWDFSNPAYPLVLRDAGYRIGHTYKVWSPGTPRDAPHGGNETRFSKHGSKFNGFSQNAMKAKDREAAKAALLDEVRMNVRSFLDGDDDGTLDGDDPVCYFLGPTNVHRKWIAGSGKALWGIDPENLRGRLPAYLPDTPEVRQDYADYLGEIAAFDAALGVLDEELRRVGIVDDTLLVVSGDHGIPGVPRGKCTLYDTGTHVPLAIRWPAGMPTTGRVIDDYVSLPDLAVTFVELGGGQQPDAMIARSLVPQIKSDASGWIDPDRNVVYTGRERHVDAAREGKKPYPQRAIRTPDFLYIINFEPERYPMGDGPPRTMSGDEVPSAKSLRENTRTVYPDLDASPIKQHLVEVRDRYPLAFEFAFGRPPKYELYDMRTDPDCMTNLAGNPVFQATQSKLQTQLLDYLRQTGDPRLNDPVPFESGFFVR